MRNKGRGGTRLQEVFAVLFFGKRGIWTGLEATKRKLRQREKVKIQGRGDWLIEHSPWEVGRVVRM